MRRKVNGTPTGCGPVPLGKMGEAWDVAYAALFLASDEAKFVTDALLVVDGGPICKFT